MTRVALVTGAARGIGRAVAQRLAADGFDVAAVDLRSADCGQTIDAVTAAGRRGLALAGDVSDEASVADVVAQTAEQLGPPAVLVNNAGILREGLASKTELADWQMLLEVNLTGTFLMSRAASSHMRTAGWGRVVNLSSIGARGLIGLGGYGAAKAGVQSLTQTLAIELGRYGITVNAVAPGFIATDMNRDLAQRTGRTYDELEAEMIRDVPVGRAGTPDDIAQVVSFFADERSGFVSGQVLYATGGA